MSNERDSIGARVATKVRTLGKIKDNLDSRSSLAQQELKLVVMEPPVTRKVPFIPSPMPKAVFPERREQPKYCDICHTFGCKEHPNG
jgi:hypothetical protein